MLAVSMRRAVRNDSYERTRRVHHRAAKRTAGGAAQPLHEILHGRVDRVFDLVGYMHVPGMLQTDVLEYSSTVYTVLEIHCT